MKASEDSNDTLSFVLVRKFFVFVNVLNNAEELGDNFFKRILSQVEVVKIDFLDTVFSLVMV